MSFLLPTSPFRLALSHDNAFAVCTRNLSPSIATTTKTSTEKKRKALKHVFPRFTAQLADFGAAASAAYGTLLLGGGLFAYARSGSKGSLLGGVSGAVLMGTAYFLMQVSETKYLGDALGFGSAFLFSSVFGIRLAATRKLVPAGPLLALSVGVLAIFVSAYLQDRTLY